MEVRELTPDERSRLREERDWIAKIIANIDNDLVLKETPEDIPILQSLLEIPPFASGAEGPLQALGTVFGTVIVRTLGLEWVVITDNYGCDFAIKHPSETVMAFPRDMIVKRVEEGEEINLTVLYNDSIKLLREKIEISKQMHEE
ncbi:DUF3806 domain-containing protein [bacterium]|nr:DUF3806 domain-containing protein [bacterium]